MKAEIKTVYVIEDIRTPKKTKIKQRYVAEQTFKKAIENKSENIIPLFVNSDLAHIEYVRKDIIFSEKPTHKQIERKRIEACKNFALEKIKFLNDDIERETINLKNYSEEFKKFSNLKKESESRIKSAKKEISDLKKKHHLKF